MFLKKHMHALLPAYLKWGEFKLSVTISIKEHQQKSFAAFSGFWLLNDGC